MTYITSTMTLGAGKVTAMSEKKPSTKKLLVAFDPKMPDAGSGDFVVPVSDADGVSLVGLRSGKRCVWGRMVYLGREVTMNDLVARLVDSGRKIESVEVAIKLLGDYLTMLQEHKIGNVIALEPVEGEAAGFRLTKIANTPSGAADAGG
jgi:hypothetical protein